MKKILHIIIFIPFTLFGQNYTYVEQNIPLFLPEGWGLFGFNCTDQMSANEAFGSIEESVIIVKDYLGNPYLPSWNFDGIGNLNYSWGYQIKLTNEVFDFQFCPTIIALEEGCTDETAINYDTGAIIDDGSCDYSLLQGQPKVYFYSWAEYSTNSILLGVSPFDSIIQENTLLHQFANDSNLSKDFYPMVMDTLISLSSSWENVILEPVKLIDEIHMETLSDEIIGNGISLLGTKYYNSEHLLILFPMSIPGSPSSMHNGVPSSSLVDELDRYYMWKVGNNGSYTQPSNIITFDRNGVEYGLIYSDWQFTGSYKFYLLPDEMYTNLPNICSE